MKEITKIGIIDDHKIVRHGLKELLEKLANYKVIQEFESGIEFLNTLPFLEEKADIYILDYSMPTMNGIEVLEKVSKLNVELKIMLLTQHLEEDIIDKAFHYGARGFLNKNCTALDLKFALDNIIKIGYNNISEILKRIRNFDNKSTPAKASCFLSDRELHFLELVCDERELTYEQMAEIMNVSIKSIDFYRASLFEKFQIKSKVGLVLFSYNNHLTKPFV